MFPTRAQNDTFAPNPAPTPIFFDNDSGYGFYLNEPGIAPQIHLNRLLLNHVDDSFLDTVYNVLLEYHRSIPLDSWERVRPFIRYFEELCPDLEEGQDPGPAFRKRQEQAQEQRPGRANLILVGRTVIPEEAVMMLSCFTRSPGSGQVTTWQVRIDKFRLMG